jgi:predicted nuclease of predicted toxin-antitoxin system
LIRFLANENIPLASVFRLREAGHDVLAASEAFPGAGDLEVLTCARQEDRIVLTFDRDYGELIYRRGLPSPIGVLFLRFIPESPTQVAEVLKDLLKVVGLSLENRYTIVGPDRIRQRPLP